MGRLPTLASAMGATLVAACCASAAAAQGIGRMEIHAIPSVTVSNQQFLTGDRYGKPVILGGELRLPRGATETFPAVILIHGSGGISAATDRWAQELNSVGVAALILDSFTGRGIITTNTDQSQLDSIAMMHDAFAALAKLATHPRIDPGRIAVMRLSKQAVQLAIASEDPCRSQALLQLALDYMRRAAMLSEAAPTEELRQTGQHNPIDGFGD